MLTLFSIQNRKVKYLKLKLGKLLKEANEYQTTIFYHKRMFNRYYQHLFLRMDNLVGKILDVEINKKQDYIWYKKEYNKNHEDKI